MSALSLLLVALALSLDNFTIAMAIGAQESRPRRAFVRLPLTFGALAVLSTITGWIAGTSIAGPISKFGGVAAFAILIYIGWRTLISARNPSAGAWFDASSLKSTLVLAAATSVDSLAAGFAVALAGGNALELAIMNGALCLLLSEAGLWLGEPFGRRFPMQSKIVAGLALMAVGLRSILVNKPW